MQTKPKTAEEIARAAGLEESARLKARKDAGPMPSTATPEATVMAPGGPVGRDTALGQWIAAGKPAGSFRNQPDFGMADRYVPDPMNPGKFMPAGSTQTQLSTLRDDVRNDKDIHS
jgi:hypothetical protein